MDRTQLDRSFHRAFAAGIAALALGLAGHAATSTPAARPACNLRRITPSSWLFHQVAPAPEASSLVAKVARAALALALDVCA